MSDFWSREHPDPAWALILAGALLCAFAGFGFLENLSSSSQAAYGQLGIKMGIGTIGGHIVSAIIVAGLALMTILGLKMIVTLKRPGRFSVLGPMLLGLSGDPSMLLKNSSQEAWIRLGCAVALAVIAPALGIFVERSEAKAKQGLQNKTGQP